MTKEFFSTSLPNEYSLFACSAKNNNADDFDIIKNLEILSEEAKKSRFTPQKKIKHQRVMNQNTDLFCTY